MYDPHIVPVVERWQAEFEASRARRRQRRGPVSVETSIISEDHTGSGTELQSLRPQRSGSDADDGEGERTSNELEKMVAQEVDEWRSGVDRSQGAGLRQRRIVGQSGSALEEVGWIFVCITVFWFKKISDEVKCVPPIHTHLADPHSVRLLSRDLSNLIAPLIVRYCCYSSGRASIISP